MELCFTSVLFLIISYDINQKTAPTNNKLWDGYLRLNSALTVSTIAAFIKGN